MAPGLSAGLATDGIHVFSHDGFNRIAAVRLSDRRIAWTALTDETLATRGLQGVGYCGGHVVFSSYLALYGAAPSTGDRRWRRPNAGTMAFSQPVCHQGAVFVTASLSARTVLSLDPASGQTIWATELPSTSTAESILWSTAVDSAAVAVCTRVLSVPFTGELFLLDRRTGAVRWSTVFPVVRPNAPSGCRYPPAIAGGVVVTTLDDGLLRAYDIATGALRWTAPGAYESPNALDERPLASAGNVIIAGSLRGFVIGYDATTGQEAWRFIVGDGVASIIWGDLAIDSTIAVGTGLSGSALAFDPFTGRRLWTATGGAVLGERTYWPRGIFAGGLYVSATTSGLVAIRR